MGQRARASREARGGEERETSEFENQFNVLSLPLISRLTGAGQLEEADKRVNYQTEDKAEIHERLNFGRTVLPRHFA